MSDNRNIDAVERNVQRAACAEAAVGAYAQVKASNITDLFDLESEDAQERLTDLLADLRHWAGQSGVDFEAAARMSETHFNCELDEEADQEGSDAQ